MSRKTKRLGRYHLTERIAYGGMAEIFRGFTFSSEGFRHDVAIKKLLPHYVEDQQFITMLTDEYRLVSMLKHENIADVYELVELADTLLIAMEYVDGKDLRSTVEKARRSNTSLRFDDIVYVMASALDGLHHAHNAEDESGDKLQIVHRDFSPSNVLLSYDGLVKICDFGIAKAKLSRVKTRAGIIKGKVKYMSPEQAFGKNLDRRSDVFSAGSVLYELCTGRPPFRANSEVELIFAVRKANAPDCRAVNPHIPEGLADIIRRSMMRARAARYQSSLEFRDALVEFLSRFNADYRATRLARFMKKLWEPEIDAELRALEEFALDLTMDDKVDYGKNLIADALGPDAQYEKFQPRPTHSNVDPLALDNEPTVVSSAPMLELLSDKTRVTPPKKK